MEEVYLSESGDIGEYLKDMHQRVSRDNPVIGWANGVRIVMFIEEKNIDPQYDGPR
jgi:hypothetical protein